MKKIFIVLGLLFAFGVVSSVVAVEPLHSFTLGQDGVVIHSGPALGSPSVSAHRANTMGGLVGVSSIPMDRNVNPAAFVPIPSDGLQSFDYTTTSFDSWLGTASTNGQRGHRCIVSVAGVSPVSAYSCRITSSDTNVGSKTFGVGTNAAGAELGFSSTFVGINLGANGVLDSSFDPAQGAWVQRGDDTLYVGGQSPSTVAYHVWYRFGGQVFVTITSPSGFDAINGQFATSNQWLTAELLKSGVPVASRTVTEAVPRLGIAREGFKNPSPVRISVLGGQLRVPYTLVGAPSIHGSPWMIAYGQAIYTETQVTLSNSAPMRFFRTRKGF